MEGNPSARVLYMALNLRNESHHTGISLCGREPVPKSLPQEDHLAECCNHISHIEAMGGHLDVVARFPDGAVRISNFSELDPGAER